MIDLKPFTNYSDILIETGTARGDGVKRALFAGFRLVLTVEADITLFKYARDHFLDNEKVIVFFGDSYKVLSEMLKELGRCVIVLDAHPAGPGTHGHDELLKGNFKHNQDYIITKELKEILMHRNDHIIIIDDQAGFNELTGKYIDMCRIVNENYSALFLDDGEFKGKYLILTV